jgi:hypothetical protein
MLLDHGLDQGNRQTLNCRRGLYDRASSETRECAVIEGVNELESSNIPLLAPPQGGVAERSRRCREASTEREGGVVFRLRKRRKTTPSASVSVASRNFINDAATPPCGDARRGIYRSHTFRHFFHSSYDRASFLESAKTRGHRFRLRAVALALRGPRLQFTPAAFASRRPPGCR